MNPNCTGGHSHGVCFSLHSLMSQVVLHRKNLTFLSRDNYFLCCVPPEICQWGHISWEYGRRGNDLWLWSPSRWIAARPKCFYLYPLSLKVSWLIWNHCWCFLFRNFYPTSWWHLHAPATKLTPSLYLRFNHRPHNSVYKMFPFFPAIFLGGLTFEFCTDKLSRNVGVQVLAYSK
jgi:hypothetical protein